MPKPFGNSSWLRCLVAAWRNGDARADFIVGGNGGTVRVIFSTGHFGASQNPAVNYTLVTGSTMNLPALADLNGDGRLDC